MRSTRPHHHQQQQAPRTLEWSQARIPTFIDSHSHVPSGGLCHDRGEEKASSQRSTKS